MRPNPVRRLLRSAALVVALGATAAMMAAGPASATQDGVNVAGFFGTPAQNAQVESLVDQLHPAWIRVFLVWGSIEPAPGSYDLGQIGDYESLFAALPAGTKVDVDVVGSPAWANGGSSSSATPPTNDQSFAGFMNYIANAFGKRVTAYEIWNEEDSSANWSGTPAQFVGLLAAAYPAIKSANPGATVILGGLGANDYPYLQQLYAAGAGHYFDAVGVHTDDACSLASPYSFALNQGAQTIQRWSFLGFTTVHSVMAANGDGAEPIYMTEFGWSTSNTTCSTGVWAGKKAGGVSEATQALYLQQAYHCLAQPQYSYVTAAMWYDMVDSSPVNNIFDRYGLTTSTLVPRPSFGAFQQESEHGDQLSGTCGTFAGPKLRLMAPFNGERYSGPLMVRVTATANGSPVAQIALQHDGKNILNFNRIDAHYAHGVLSGHIDWQGAPRLSLGKHTITVVATNSHGVTSTLSVTVIHVGKHKKH